MPESRWLNGGRSGLMVRYEFASQFDFATRWRFHREQVRIGSEEREMDGTWSNTVHDNLS